MHTYDLQKGIIDLLLSVFPDDSFKEHIDTFDKAINRPANMRRFLVELGSQLDLGVTNHIMIARAARVKNK